METEIITTNEVVGQEYLDDLYEIARSRDDPMLLDSLENFLAATVDNLLRKQAENEHLELSLKRATLKNTEMTSQLEQEMDAHVNMLEEKIRQEEQRKLDAQKKQAQNELVRAQRELSEMENRVKELEEKIEQKSVEASIPDQIIEEMQEKEKENEKLRSQLLEFQTQMAVMRTDVTNMKSEYDEQSLRLNQERGTVMSCVREQENLTRQLHMLHEANKKLHDTNDDLRTAVESQRNSLNESMSPTKRAMSQHFSRGTLPNLHSSFRSDPGRQAKDMLRGYTTHTTDFDDTDVEDISGRSLLPYDDDDEDVNEESLMSELMQADQHMTGSKDRSKVSRSLSNSVLSSPQRQHLDREHFVAQLQILCDTNRRLGESNDELRQALGLLSERVPPRSPTKRCMSPAGCQSAPVTPAKQTFRGEECCASSPRKKAYNTTTTTDATYETKYRRTNMSRDNIWLNSNTSSVLQNIESELSRVGRHENEASDDDMEEEELVRLVDESNDISTSLSISDEELLTTTQGGVRGREVAPKSDKRVPVQGDRPEKRSVVVFNELPTTHQPKGVRGLGVGADTVDTNFTETANHEPEDLGKPEKVYKLVLAGNAAVGKSSFIIRLCRDKFYSALNSTLGVDFQLKTMRVDGVTVALQLWDTAGQERFRSIAKSYFRKVDGVILMYDVTCENSFADVRDWVESIEEGATNKVPIMICGNKVDMRRRCLSQGMPVVARSVGRRLAEEIGAMFVETSAKDGSNVNNACLEFARLLQQNEAEKLTPNASNGLSLGNSQNKQAQKNTTCCR